MHKTTLRYQRPVYSTISNKEREESVDSLDGNERHATRHAKKWSACAIVSFRWNSRITRFTSVA